MTKYLKLQKSKATPKNRVRKLRLREYFSLDQLRQ